MPNTRKAGQTLPLKRHPRPTPRTGRESRTSSNTSQQIPARVIEADTACKNCSGGLPVFDGKDRMCAKRTASVDVKRPLRIGAVEVAVGETTSVGRYQTRRLAMLTDRPRRPADGRRSRP